METIKRFYKNREYIGVMTHTRDGCGFWLEGIQARRFNGKPHDCYDEVFEYTSDKWDTLLETAHKQADQLCKVVVENTYYFFLGTKWIDGKVQATTDN